MALIESGHGLQPLWRIGSPRGDSNVVDRDRSRDEWRTPMALGCRRAAGRAGSNVVTGRRPEHATIDNVYDLSRVLRCPGSVNWKDPNNPVPVRTHLFERGGRVRAGDLVRGMDRDDITPLPTSPR